MIWLTVLVLLVLVGGLGVAALCRPRSVSGWVALTLCGAWAGVMLVVDGVGRVRYDAPTVLIGSFVFAAFGVYAWRASGAELPARVLARVRAATRPWWLRAFLLLWAGLIGYSVVSVWVMPASVPDVLRYHLPMSVAWMREGRVGVSPELDYRANFFPHGVQILSGLTILLRGDDRMSAMPQVVLSGVLFPLVCYAMSRVCGLRRHFAAASALLASLCAPVVLQMRHETSDVGHYAALMLAVAVSFDAVRGSPRICSRRWVAMGIAAGLALGTKSSGPLVVACLALGWVGAQWVRARYNPLKIFERRFLSRSFGVLGLTLLIGSWVFVGNTIKYANPVYPMIIQLGPVTLPGPGDDSPLKANKWIYDFSQTPAQRLAGGVERWPELMLSLPKGEGKLDPDFRDNRSPTNSGFGYVTSACTVLSGVFGLAAAVVLVARRRVPRRTAAWVGLGATLGVYNAAYLSMVSLITAPQSTVDARYQIHLAYIVALVFVGAMGYLWRRRLAMLVMIPMFVLSVYVLFTMVGYDLLEDRAQERVPQPHRGWKAISAMMDRDLPRLWGWTGRPYFLSREPDELFELLDGEKGLILLGRGRSYPYMITDPNRRVFTVGAQGPDLRVNTSHVEDEVLLKEFVEFYIERWRMTPILLTPDEEGHMELLEAHSAEWPTTRIIENTRRYYKEVAIKHNLNYLVSTAGRYQGLEGNGVTMFADPHWELVYFSEHRNGRLATAVYKFRHDLAESDDYGIVGTSEGVEYPDFDVDAYFRSQE